MTFLQQNKLMNKVNKILKSCDRTNTTAESIDKSLQYLVQNIPNLTYKDIIRFEKSVEMLAKATAEYGKSTKSLGDTVRQLREVV